MRVVAIGPMAISAPSSVKPALIALQLLCPESRPSRPSTGARALVGMGAERACSDHPAAVDLLWRGAAAQAASRSIGMTAAAIDFMQSALGANEWESTALMRRIAVADEG